MIYMQVFGTVLSFTNCEFIIYAKERMTHRLIANTFSILELQCEIKKEVAMRH